MNLSTVLDAIALTLIVTHFGIPLAYYLYAKKKWLSKSWNIKLNLNYRPKITIIVPTYNEAKFIEKRLEDIYKQNYPKNKLEVIVVDSASTDGTPEIVEEWVKKHLDIEIKLIQETERKGKAHALNTALKYATGEIVTITDADAWWPSNNTLIEVVKWFGDPIVGTVSCLKNPASVGVARVEEGYRQYYNVLRLAESKAWSTPIFHGELAAFKKGLLEKVSGFPTDIGADDSHTATRIALMGFRAIIPENLMCIEAVPRDSYHLWRIRRAQHLIQHFIKTFTIRLKIPRPFKPILYMEIFLHLVNPWMLLAAALSLLTSIAIGDILATVLLALGVSLLAYKPYRTWIITQAYLITAAIRNIWTKEITWKKQAKPA